MERGGCQVSVSQRKSSLLSIMNSLRMGPLVFKDWVFNSASLRCDCVGSRLAGFAMI